MASANINQYVVRHQLLVRAALIIAVILILLVMAVLPLISRIQSTMGKITVRAKAEKILVDKVTILSQLDQNVLKERLQTLDYALPPRKDVVTYLASVDGLSRELGLSFGGLSLSPGEVSAEGDVEGAAKTKSSLQTLDTTIKIRGDQSAIYSFLRSVAQTLPLMQVKDVKLSSVGSGQYDMSLSLGMLWASAGVLDVNGPIEIFNEKEESYFQALSTYRSYRPEFGVIAAPISELQQRDLFTQ